MRIGSMFSGIGGFELGLELAGLGPVVWQCESDLYCREILQARWPGCQLYTDVTTLRGANLPYVDVICGGFPCQDISFAGGGAGLAGDRSGLWFSMLEVIRNNRPRYVAVENVGALRRRGLDVVLQGLASCGYDAIWFSLQAVDLGAPHRRERVFVVAYRGNNGREACRQVHDQTGIDDAQREVADGRDVGMARPVVCRGEPVADAVSGRRAAVGFPPAPFDDDGWKAWIAQGGPEPAVRRGTDGIPVRSRNAQLRALGNAVVPACAEVVGHVLLDLERRAHRMEGDHE